MPQWASRYLDWVNGQIYTNTKVEIRRIDVILVIGFIGCVSYYWITTGWQGALIGAFMYALMAMIALFML
jgi:hypothetical protein